MERAETQLEPLQTHEDMNGTSDVDSLDGPSENGDISDLDSEKMDPAHREILEKLKRQEKEEREEIERELKEHRAVLALHQAEDLRIHTNRGPEGRDSSVSPRDKLNSTPSDKPDRPDANEIRMQRPLGLLAQHGLSLGKPLERHLHPQHPAELYGYHPAYLDRLYHDRVYPPTPPSRSSDSHPPPPPPQPQSNASPPSHWSYEEQFKQLYELSDDPERKKFLDDLFSFMQKRGTPVNRIPIMAKQTLDLYELFKLVVSKGGLVDVINKKLWREITKGLNLPSSITSAAFTLRTQYMKYLYPYECEKLKLSSPAELQAAIDGNRREGRRPSYGYDLSPAPTLLPPQPHPHLNGGLMNGRPPTAEDSLPSSPTHLREMRSIAERDARAMEAAARAMEEATKRMEEASRAALTTNHPTKPPKDDSPPVAKRPTLEEDRHMPPHTGISSTHIKITSRNDGRTEFDNSLVVSMEVNGIMYQGVLFAQHRRI